MASADVDTARTRLDPAGVEWVSYTCQLSGETETILIIGEQLASRLVNFVPAVKDAKDCKILAGLYSAELCECDVATLTQLSDDEVVTRLKKLAAPGLVLQRKILKMNYFSLASEDARYAINNALKINQ
jgi:hypothetical protein